MPLSIKRRVTLDLSRTGYQITIPFMKSDRVAHEVYITVKDGTEPVILPPGTMAAITVFNGVEGGVVDNLVVDHANNVLMYVPSPNALAVAGNVKCTLTLFDELGAVIGAPSMIFGVMNSDTEEIGEEIQAALEANPSWGLIVTAAQSAESAKASATEASQAAVEAYTSELQAKFYSEAAQDSETIVNMYKADALTYRNVAEHKATEAANSAAAAKASEESARADAASVVGSRAEIDSEINRVSDTAGEALSIASGATQAITVQDYAALVELLNNTNKFEFNVGQNIYVETHDVPDAWVKGYANDPIEYTYTTDANLERELLGGYLQIGYTLLSPLEGAKVDLTDYAKKTYVNSEIGKSEDRSSTKIREANERIDANEAAINSANEQIDSANRSISANTANITALEQSTAEQISTVAKHTAAVESKAIRNDKRLTNLEAGIPDDDFITDNSVAYVRDVPSNALPYAEITEIGGMTYKEGNVLRSASVYEVVSVGVNLFGGDALKDKFKSEMPRTTTIDTVNKTITYYASETEGKTFFTNFKPNKQYTFILKGSSSARYPNLTISYTDGTKVTFQFAVANTAETLVRVSDATKSVKSLAGAWFDGSSTLYYDECGIFEGVLTAEDFKPYIKRTVPIPEAVRPAHGIPNTDCYDRVRWRYDEATDKWVRESEKRLGVVDLGTLSWQYGNLFGTGVYCFFAEGATDANNKGTYSIANILCHLYDATSANEIAQRGTTGIALYEKLIVICDTNYTDAEIFKSAMSGVMLVYELANPEITDISHLLPEDNLIGVEGGGSMTPVNEHGDPVPMTITYQIEEETV